MLTRFVLLTMAAGCLLLSNATAADGNAEKTQKLIGVLQSNAPLFEKARACQQLGEFGDAQAVPALAALLADEHLSAYARSGLEGIPDPSAAETLRTATATLKGNQLKGVINSLGVLRDAKAVGLLKKLAGDPASGAAKEAMLALGCIGTVEAIATITLILAEGPDSRRDDAAAACLLAAEKKLSDGQPTVAVILYDGVRKTSVPPLYRAAATRGAIVARKVDGVPLLIETLRSKDRLFRNTALITIREIPCDALANALNAELDHALPELQIQLLIALVDCHNAQSLVVIQAKVGSEEAEVRKTALTVLGQISDPAAVGVMLKAVADNRSAEESAIAQSSLKNMEGSAIDGQIVNALISATNTESRVAFIGLLEARRATNSVGELLKQAAGPDAKVGVAAFGALTSLAGRGELAPLISLTKTCKDDAVSEAAENAVVGVCARTGDTAMGATAVLAELKQARDSAAKNSWIRILISLGDPKALPEIVATLHDADEPVAANTIAQLARWPDPAPMDDLLSVLQSGANAAQRKRALASVIRLATTAADEHQRPEDTLVKWFKLASQAAQTTEEKRLIISGLGRVKHVGSFRLLASYLDDPDLQKEAAAAVVQIAPDLRQTNPAALKEALEKGGYL